MKARLGELAGARNCFQVSWFMLNIHVNFHSQDCSCSEPGTPPSQHHGPWPLVLVCEVWGWEKTAVHSSACSFCSSPETSEEVPHARHSGWGVNQTSSCLQEALSVAEQTSTWKRLYLPWWEWPDFRGSLHVRLLTRGLVHVTCNPGNLPVPPDR